MSTVKQWARTLASLPEFEDEDIALIARFAYPIAWAGVFITSVLFVVHAVFAPASQLFRLQFVIPMFLISLLAVGLVRRGRIGQTARKLVVFAWIGLVIIMIEQGGARAPSFGFYVLIALSPFIVGRRSGTILAVMTVAVGVVLLVVGEQTGWLSPVVEESAASWWLRYSLGLLFIAIPADLMACNIRRTLRSKQESERRHRSLFQDSPVALWEEDFSAIKPVIGDLKAQGVTDFQAYFGQHPAALARCAGLINVLDVNQTALKLYGATDKAELLAHLSPTNHEVGYKAFGDELVALAEGKTAFVGDPAIIYTVHGQPRYTTLRLSIVPGHEERWDRVVVSVSDLTEQLQTQAELQTLYNFQSLITNLAMDFINMSPDELDQGINEVLQRVTQFIGADAGIVFRLLDDDPNNDNLLATITNEWIDPRYTPMSQTLAQVRGADFPWVQDQLRHAEVVNIHRVADLPPAARSMGRMMENNGIRSMILVPLLIYQSHMRGFLGYCTLASEVYWPPDVIALLKVVAEIVMNAMEHQRAQAHRLELVVERERVDLLRLMIGNLSHDLKAPLSVIKANLYLAQKLPDPARRQAKLDAILEQTERIDTLILDLMTLARLESGVPELKLEPLNVGLLLKDIAAQLKPLSEEKRLHVTVHTPPDLPPVLADRSELSRVFVNLVQNAINYTPEDQSITIRVGQQDTQIVADIQDTGIGIPEKDLALIFDRFYRTDEARAMVVTGTGLGLPIVKRIVEIHEGEVGVQSVLGAGSTFSVRLPIWSGKFV